MRTPPDAAEGADCVVLVGVSRPKLAAALLSVALLSLFLTFHVLYDSALYTVLENTALQAELAAAVSQQQQLEAATGTTGAEQELSTQSRVHFARTHRRLPQALIIGVRKCGTRALLEMLALHPRIQKAAGEVHFFDRDDNYRRGLEWYRHRMPHSFRGQVTIEKSPSYFVTPEVSMFSNYFLTERELSRCKL